MNKLILAVFLALAPNAFASLFYVNGLNGNDNNNCMTPQTACKTIGHAISVAASGDSILVSAATYTENLNIAISLNIVGAGARWSPITTIIDGGGLDTTIKISSSTARVTLARLMIRNGAGALGGGISNFGKLTIYNATISGNRGIPCGGGIFSHGPVTIYDTTISGNTASKANGYGLGGGIYTFESLVLINNSTFSGNSAGVGYGGGIYNDTGTLVASNDTFAANSAGDGYGGGGIYNFTGNAILQNSIVANSSSGGNCEGDPFTSDGYNLSSDETCNLQGSGDLNNVDPDLGPLQNNGGPTQTQALLLASPAIDAGNPTGCTDGYGNLLKTDQRGAPRPDKEDTGGCDMGAFERQSD